ncbi:Type 1 glutamine amidotransferase-like domain-containing protein [Bacillus sp. RG28]|uniref:Type 1 glutamine amidotransferase-like domain-containing protein n=1 Tax=Gottfriedia endophytica TaxID=2820819 RepID=A0A940SHR3_9BACI|nr:Type 1 glutamine amidotransferase-like domain-containing protein [Gottfriedia endophytica]MBP0723766.1 Type 1 glutamine amidotransferase-like domain-containing protein [Gottfriedia endophytica]
MKNRHLFLFGGGPPFTSILGNKFAELSSTKEHKIAILFIETSDSEKYLPIYTSVLKQQGLNNFVFLPLSLTPSATFLEELRTCSGIVIGGGNTELYQNYLMESSIGHHIKTVYNEGIPVAGFSAGALVSLKNCVVQSKNDPLFLEGLGLLNDCLIQVHFSSTDEESLKSALIETNSAIGYGISENSGIYFENETLSLTEGTIHPIELNYQNK